MQALYEAETKRGTLRETLNQMAIWNVADTKIISDVIGSVTEDGQQQPPKMKKTMSVANFVRIKASRIHKQERKRANQTPTAKASV